MNDQQLKDILGSPSEEEIMQSRQRVAEWFAATAPLILWDVMDSPFGQLYIGATEEGIRAVKFNCTQSEFMAELDPLARTERRPEALADAEHLLEEYFKQPTIRFDLPVDLRQVTPFQRAALRTIRQIPAGQVWTYKQVAEQMGRPTASRAVGQAMASNPIPIIIPCHRVIGSNGALTGYGGGGGIATKRRLLQMEGAL